MKLILTQEVNGLGAPGDVVEVRDGYGRNYLLPQGLAIARTKGGEKQVASIRRAREMRGIQTSTTRKQIRSMLEALDDHACRSSRHRRAAVRCRDPGDIAAAVQAAGGPQLDQRKVELPQTIKTIGAHGSASACTGTSARSSRSRSSRLDLARRAATERWDRLAARGQPLRSPVSR